MLIKIFSLSLIICALCFSARSQESMTSAGKTSGSIDKFISAEDAAKNALNVGAKMPAFSLKDANGNAKSLFRVGLDALQNILFNIKLPDKLKAFNILLNLLSCA